MLRLAFAALILGSWEASATFEWVNPIFTSKPSEIYTALVEGLRSGDYLREGYITLYETFAGFIIGGALGIVVGFARYEFPDFDAVIRPFMVAANSLPRIALAPLFVLWLGLGTLSKIALGVTLIFFIVAENTFSGLKGVERDFLMLAKITGASRFQTQRKFILPSAIPSIFAGLQLGLVYTFLGVVAGEMIAGTAGLGARLSLSLNTYNTADFFGTLCVLVVISTSVSMLMYYLERRALAWQRYESLVETQPAPT